MWEDCLGHAGFEQFCELCRRRRPAEIVSLGLVALVSLQKCQLFLRFDALRHYSQPKASAHADYTRDDGRLVRCAGNLANKRLVDFERIDREFPQITQTGVTGAEVIHGELHSSYSEGLEDGSSGLHVLHQDAFGELQLQKSGIQTGFLEGCEYTLKKVFVPELDRRDIHRNCAQRKTGDQPLFSLSASLT